VNDPARREPRHTDSAASPAPQAADEMDTFDVGPGGDPRHPDLEPTERASTESPPPPPDEMSTESTISTGLTRPDLDDSTVEALGVLGEAVEWIERARGRLYDFHQMTGHADALLGDAADALESAGHADWAGEIRTELVGRNVLEGRWTFQVVEEYDDTYWEPIRSMRARIEAVLADGRRHVHEARLKEQRRSAGRRHHEAEPPRS
jgi:hypothetical protein